MSEDRSAHQAQDELSRFSALVELIYEGAVRAEAWSEVPRAICEWMDAPVSVIFTPLNTLERDGFMVMHNMGHLAVELWNAHFHKDDLWVQRGLERGCFQSGVTVRDQDLATEEELQATGIYRDWLAPQNIGRSLSTVVYGLEQSRVPPVVCTLNRPLHHPFSERECQRLALLGPHLHRALGVMFMLREADFKLATTLSALNHLERAVILLDRRGRVFHVNALAQAILDRSDGLSLSPWKNEQGLSELMASGDAQQLALEQALDQALKGGMGPGVNFKNEVRVARSGHPDPYVLQLSPLPVQNEFGCGGTAPAVIVFVEDRPPGPALSEPVMSAHYGLSPAELRVIGAAMDGGTVAIMAGQLHLSENTIRTHLKRIYEKTGVRSRSQLVKLAMASRMMAMDGPAAPH